MTNGFARRPTALDFKKLTSSSVWPVAPGVDVASQACKCANSTYCTSWVFNTYRKEVCDSSPGVPKGQFIVFADNPHGQTTEDLITVLEQCNTLLWLLPVGCTGVIQPVD